MGKDELKAFLDQENLGIAYVFPIGNWRQELYLKMEPENIANFIKLHEFNAEKLILADMADRFILDTVYGGFIENCPDQEFLQEVLKYLVPLQLGEREPKEVAVITYDEALAFWDEEELAEEMDQGIHMM